MKDCLSYLATHMKYCLSYQATHIKDCLSYRGEWPDRGGSL
jgi:hypothetical protein